MKKILFWKIIWVKLKIHIFPWAKVYQHLNMNLWYIYNAYIVTCRINMENLRYVYLKRFMMQLYLLNQSINQINFIFKNKLICFFFSLSLCLSCCYHESWAEDGRLMRSSASFNLINQLWVTLQDGRHPRFWMTLLQPCSDIIILWPWFWSCAKILPVYD